MNKHTAHINAPFVLLNSQLNYAGNKQWAGLVIAGTQADIENRNILEDQRPPRMNTIVMDATYSSDVAHPSGDGDGATNTMSPRGLHQDGFILKIPEAYLVERQDSKDNDNCKIIVRLI